LPCYFTCDFLKDINESYHGKIPEIETPDIKDNFDFEPGDNSLYGIMNVTYDNYLFKVFVKETNASKINIKIYNLQGEMLLDKV